MPSDLHSAKPLSCVPLADCQRAKCLEITVTLTNVNDSLGGHSASVQGKMGVLLGDTNGDRTVNSGDLLQTRNRAGQQASASNFRSDVNLAGTINSGDAFVVRARSGSALP